MILNSLAILVKAGATIDDETGEMNVKDDTTIVAAHFFFIVQFFGFSGSLVPFHVTYQEESVSRACCSHDPISGID